MADLNLGYQLLEDLILTLASSGASEGHFGDRHAPEQGCFGGLQRQSLQSEQSPLLILANTSYFLVLWNLPPKHLFRGHACVLFSFNSPCLCHLERVQGMNDQLLAWEPTNWEKKWDGAQDKPVLIPGAGNYF